MEEKLAFIFSYAPGAYEPASCADYVDRQPMPVSVGIIPLPGCIRRTYRQYCRPVQTLDEAMEKSEKG